MAILANTFSDLEKMMTDKVNLFMAGFDLDSEETFMIKGPVVAITPNDPVVSVVVADSQDDGVLCKVELAKAHLNEHDALQDLVRSTTVADLPAGLAKLDKAYKDAAARRLNSPMMCDKVRVAAMECKTLYALLGEAEVALFVAKLDRAAKAAKEAANKS